jgi:RND superfamily putative drug exporter
MFTSLGRFSVRFRWFIIVAWILAVPVLAANLPNISDVSKNNNSDFLPKNNPSAKTVDLESSFQGKESVGVVYIVAARNSGSLTAADNQAISRIIAAEKTQKAVISVRSLGVSADGSATQLQVSLGSTVNGPNSVKVLNDIRNKLNQNLPDGLQAHLAGAIAETVDAENQRTHGKDNTQLFTIIFILALLFFVFRAVLAPLVTLFPAAVALAVAQPLIAELTKVGVKVSFITEILLIVLILGAGTDYGLFLVFRVREELRNGLAPKEAVVKALSRVGESITFSALTVAAALLSLLLASFGIYKGLGPALAIGLAVMLLSALTLLPALLAVLGRAVFWPTKTVKIPLKIGVWGRVADRVIQRPLTMLALGAVIFGALTLGLTGYHTTGFTNNGAPSGTDSAKGGAILQQHFPASSNNPQLVIFHYNKSIWNDLSVVEKTRAEIAHSGEFKSVNGPFDLKGYNLTPQALQAVHSNDPNSPLIDVASQFISPDGKTFQLFVVSKTGTSGSVKSISNTPALRAVVASTAKSTGASQYGIYGDDAIAYDINKVAISDLKKVIPVVLIIIGVLLAVLLRSLVAPWYLVLTVALSYLATLGFAMIVFVHLGNQDGLNFILPFLLFIFCMALGEDYNILVMSRIREEARGKVPLDKAVTKAVGITGTTVTSAGLILAGTFTVLGLVGGDIQIQEIGFSIAFGILLDTFFVRTLLVPSIVTLLGPLNWWPSALSKK